jgi:hypothetical protein
MTHLDPSVAWHLRVFELPIGRWSCRWSSTTFDDHDTLQAALDHLRVFANSIGPCKVFLHTRSGEVEMVAALDPTDRQGA